MLFNSIHFLIFAPIVILVFFSLPNRFRNVWLLLASLYFYAVFKVPFIVILLGSCIWTHLTVAGIAKANSPKAKMAFLWLAILGNGSILYFLKYIDFSIRVFNQFMGLGPCDTAFVQPTGVVLPMGISFFTLQAIAFAVDVKRGNINPPRHVLDMTLFLSFFPQLVAGPIMRAKDLVHQFQETQVFTKEGFQAGLWLITIGLFKKTMIADAVGLSIDEVYKAPTEYNAFSSLFVGYLHMLQIYCDFSGYSDVAIGTARILGFQIPANFLRPFFADSMNDMWRRWHISLSSWLRDYIYISMGGNRVSAIRSYFNVFMTMVIGGAWHGADWTFIIWGLIHAIAIVVERFILSFTSMQNLYAKIPYFLRAFYAVSVFSFALIFFRAHPVGEFSEGYQVGIELVTRGFTFASGKMIDIPLSLYALTALLFTMEFFQEKGREIKSASVQYIIAATVLTVCFYIYSVTASPQFIYFQF